MTPALLLALGLASSARSQAPAPAPSGWRLVWSDEFDGPDGAAPDPSKWTFEVGGDGFGNHELEYYTSRRENSRLEGGALAIVARRETYSGALGDDGTYVTPRLSVQDRLQSFMGWLGVNPYTSARLTTFGKFAMRYGRAEARLKIPAGRGLWPVFWLLGADIVSKGWPECGEIDIMENVGHELDTVHGTIHGPGYSGGDSIGASYVLRRGAFADAYHVFAVEWEPAAVRFSVDGSLYETLTPADVPKGSRWVFDHPFFVILNLAVGGDCPGSPDPSLQFPKTLLVDYVRVYERVSAPPALTLAPPRFQ